MKTYKISSPAYKANGLDGTYYSIAICNDDNTIIDIIGDHDLFISEYKGADVNIMQGKSFSDSDRFISINQINCDIDKLSSHTEKYTKYKNDSNKWEAKELELCNGDRYSFFYDKKGKKIVENHNLHDEWLKENPRPISNVNYYDFLKTIIHEN